MRKIVGLLVVLGAVLMGVGFWWLFTHSSQPFTPEETPLQEVQEIGVEQSSFNGGVLLGTPDGMQVLKIQNGEVAAVAGSLSKIHKVIRDFSQSADNSYWLLQTSEVPMEGDDNNDPEAKHWYLVDWKTNKLQRLDETLGKQAVMAGKEVVSVAWGSASTIGIALLPEKSDPSATAQQYALGSLDLSTLKFQDFGTITTSDLQMQGMDALLNELVFKHKTGTIEKISGKRYNSNQTVEIVSDASGYLTSNNTLQNRQAVFNGTQVDIVQLPDLSVLATISPTASYALEPQITWASSGEVFATVEYQPRNLNKKIVTFYATNGSRLYSLEVNGSVTVQLSADGTAAVVTSQEEATDETTTEQTENSEPAVVKYQYVKIFEGSDEVFSNLPMGSSVLGVF